MVAAGIVDILKRRIARSAPNAGRYAPTPLVNDDSDSTPRNASSRAQPYRFCINTDCQYYMHHSIRQGRSPLDNAYWHPRVASERQE